MAESSQAKLVGRISIRLECPPHHGTASDRVDVEPDLVARSVRPQRRPHDKRGSNALNHVWQYLVGAELEPIPGGRIWYSVNASHTAHGGGA